MNYLKSNLSLIVWVVLCQLAGGIGSLFTSSAIPDWYASLVRPAIAPPNWIFGPVWTTLYLLMGIAAWLVWRRRGEVPVAKIGLTIFGVQLVLNSLWSILFFGLHSPEAAFVEIIFLWIAIVATIVWFAKVSKSAAWLLVPYLAWVSFAAYLNYQFYVLN